MRRACSTALLAAVACAALCAPAAASAHAVLVESSPPDGAVLEAAPGEATLRFNSRIEKRLTRVELHDGAGRTLPVVHVDKDGEPPDRLTVRLPPLGAGAYRLTYRVLAVDGHATPGQLRFTIRPAGSP